jgi:hypothetical protein
MTSTMQKNSIKYSRVDSHDRWFRSSHVSMNNSPTVIMVNIRTSSQSYVLNDAQSLSPLFVSSSSNGC